MSEQKENDLLRELGRLRDAARIGGTWQYRSQARGYRVEEVAKYVPDPTRVPEQARPTGIHLLRGIEEVRRGAESTTAPTASSTEQRFVELAREWKEAVRFASSLEKMIVHPAYQRIIGLGPLAVPLLLREMAERPHHWHWALRSITGANPVKPDDEGNVNRMASAWIQWGRAEGYSW